MNVYLTFDIEIWCDGWKNLDNNFPVNFERYVYGHSPNGSFALPKTLEILARYDLDGIFFVEPLFAARFGIKYLEELVGLIKTGNHDIQLHLHPEWTDEIRPLIFEGAHRKRQHLSFYSLDEQCALIQLGRKLLADAGGGEASAFRAGSFAVNEDTYRALSRCRIHLDSSLNPVHPDSGLDLRKKLNFLRPQVIDKVTILPMTVFSDGTGRLRPTQVGACGFGELREALESAASIGIEHFVILSHNFEMMKPGCSEPDVIVVRRFEKLCKYLSANRDRYQIRTFRDRLDLVTSDPDNGLPTASLVATLVRYVEQGLRRITG